MDLELWMHLCLAIAATAQRWPGNRRRTHPISRIVQVHLWAVLHDRPISWACQTRHWRTRQHHAGLPHQSCMSRRTREPDFDRFLMALGDRLRGKPTDRLVRIIDGKPLELPGHSRDPHARVGRGTGRMSVGYKLHLIDGGRPMPEAFVVTPLNRCEKQMARRLIDRVVGGGYLLGDANYNASWLFDYCQARNHQLIAPRAKPDSALGHCYQAPGRLRSMQLLEPPAALNRFGPQLYALRVGIERGLGNLASFGGGLWGLPPWVRGMGRVRRWVTAKLLINAARIRTKRKTSVDA